MDEAGKMESLSSAAAFVEGGIQDACDDACSICLEDFCESDPSTVTGCKHEFHLQCVLDWCQRSSQCPMCWQPISLKDPTSQELLEAVEHERDIRSNQARTTTIIHHPTFGDFELQQLPVGINEADLEERIMQHLAAAAAMGRGHHIGRREGQRGRSAGHGRPQFLVFSTNTGSSVSAPSQRGQNEPGTVVTSSPSSTHSSSVSVPAHQVPGIIQAQADQVAGLSTQPHASNVNRPGVSTARSAGQSTSAGQARGGPSDFQSFSESFKARLTSVSMKYKESITKSTRGWKERLFSRNNSVADIGSQGRRDASAEIASVSCMMEHLDTGEGTRTSGASAAQSARNYSAAQPANETVSENNTSSLPNDSSTSISLAANTSSS